MDNAKFYEVFDWSQFKDAEINIKFISTIIPNDVKSIIDVGCGNGLITNVLASNYVILGVDRSQKALEFVNTNKLLADCNNIPVCDRSFDLVLSSEVLEHLPDDIFDSTAKEFSRIAKSYILISVPNEESINKGMICCPGCNFIYHRNLHMRSFQKNSIQEIFPEFQIKEVKTFGLKVRRYSKFLSKIKHRYTPASSWIPWFWTKNTLRKSFCPKCELEYKYDYRFNFLSLLLDILNIIISPKKDFWLLVLLKRNEK